MEESGDELSLEGCVMLAKPMPRVPGVPGRGPNRSEGHKKGNMPGVSRRNMAHSGEEATEEADQMVGLSGIWWTPGLSLCHKALAAQ